MLHLAWRNKIVQQLLRLNRLTKLSLYGWGDCNQILIEVAKLNLVELDISMTFNDDTFKILGGFQNLEVLSMRSGSYNDNYYWEKALFSDAPILPPKLKCIKFDMLEISCSRFLKLIEKLKFIEEFDVGSGNIFERKVLSRKMLSRKILSRNDIEDHITFVNFSFWSWGWKIYFANRRQTTTQPTENDNNLWSFNNG